MVFLIDATWINNSAFAQKQKNKEEEQDQLTNTMDVKITSHSLWQKVPVGELTISRMSADNQNTNCEVYVDVNNQNHFKCYSNWSWRCKRLFYMDFYIYRQILSNSGGIK